MGAPDAGRLAAVEAAMVAHFGSDARRIDHARRVTAFARQLLPTEPGDTELVLATTLLHDIGIPAAEAKYGSCAGHLQEEEGPPIAREILARLGYPEPFIAEACAIIAAHHSPGEVETANFRLVWDADWLVNVPDELGALPPAELERRLPRIFMTASGLALARQLFLTGKKD